MNDLNYLVAPQSIALIGASNHPEKIGYQILHNILDGGYKGEIFPINPKGGKVLDLNVFSNLNEVSNPIDLAIIAIPSQFVKETVELCARNKVKSIIIITAGFSETGEAGRTAENEVKAICQKNGIILLGPNCLGLINTNKLLNASFANSMPKAGNISFISQSGAIISSMIDWSKSSGIGFSKVFSMGNKALLSEADVLEYLYNDDKTSVITGYIEQLNVTPKLTETLIKYAKTKPTVILFGGKSSFGAQASASHTGSIVTSYTAVKTYLTQAGIIIADDLEDLLRYAKIFSCYQRMRGSNVAIITNAGGPGIAASDAVEFNNLNLAKLDGRIKTELKATLKPEASVNNPVDILGDADQFFYQKALEIVSKDKNVDAILVLLTPQSATKIDETAKVIADFHTDIPVISSFVGGEILTNAKSIIEAADKPCFSFPEEAVRAIKALSLFSTAKPSLLQNKIKGSLSYNENDKMAIFAKYQLPILPYFLVQTIDDAFSSAKKINYPVVLKVADATAHKTDQGGIELNIADDGHLRKALERIGSPAILGKMIKGKFEILLGVKKEASIGTTILFGTGGIYSEIIQDFSFRIAPIDKEIAKEMISETRIGRILSGARNQLPYDLDKLAEIIVKTAQVIDDYKNIMEIDFNPIIADEHDFYIVDSRVITAKEDDGE